MCLGPERVRRVGDNSHPEPGLVMNTVPSGRACMVTALGLARMPLSGATASSVTSPCPR
jgi:hypothetical protein